MRIKAGSVPPDETQAAASSRVFNNNLDGTFTDVASAQGLALADLPVSAVVVDDFDNEISTRNTVTADRFGLQILGRAIGIPVYIEIAKLVMRYI